MTQPETPDIVSYGVLFHFEGDEDMPQWIARDWTYAKANEYVTARRENLERFAHGGERKRNYHVAKITMKVEVLE